MRGWVDPERWLSLTPIEQPQMRDGSLLSIYYEPGDRSKRIQGIIAGAKEHEDGTLSVSYIRDPFDA